MSPPLTYVLLDRLLDGKLTERIDDARADGLSYDRIARDLFIEHQVDVTGETVRRWHDAAKAAS